VTVVGLSFGVWDTSASVTLSDVPCVTSLWTSATSVSCIAAARGGSDSVVLAFGSSLMGTGLRVFSFDGPVVSTALSNVVASSGQILSLAGTNFGAKGQGQRTPTASIQEGQICASSSWTSSTSLACAVNLYSQGDLHLVVTVSAIVGSRIAQFTVDGSFV
jgi:hypothetical protein